MTLRIRPARPAGPGPVRNEPELAERMQAALADEALGGPVIRGLIAALRPLGAVAIFGGMPRDVARGCWRPFASDVDLVVDTTPERLDRFFAPSSARRNRFGGYRTTLGRQEFDVWALPSTWAVSAGHVRAATLADLVHTTFFDCDAVVYLCDRDAALWTAGHARWLRERVVDIGLEPNPHPAGAVARTLRILAEWGDGIGPALAAFLRRSLEEAPEGFADGAALLPALRALPAGAGFRLRDG